MDAEISGELSRQSILAMGRTWPNPSVACAVKTAAGIFSGATEIPGMRHAEIVALDHLDSSGSPRAVEGDLFVTLEPCSRHGRTPPCTDRIRLYPNLRIHVLSLDPMLAGEGLHRLRDAGHKLDVHTLAESPLAEAFLSGFHAHASGLGPRLHIKAAAAGRVMGLRGTRMMISGPDAAALSQVLRAKCDAVLVGPGTIASDLPALNYRGEACPEFIGVSGSDLFIDALLNHADLCAKEAVLSAYQPARLFLLSRPFEGAAGWIQRQMRLGEETGRPSVFFHCGSDESLGFWHALHPIRLPMMSHPEFSMILRHELGRQGYNDVLVEGGPGILDALLPGFASHDRVYLFKSKVPKEGDVFLPEAYLDLPVHATYESEDDFLTVSRIA